jgi:hypothetical protein
VTVFQAPTGQPDPIFALPVAREDTQDIVDLLEDRWAKRGFDLTSGARMGQAAWKAGTGLSTTLPAIADGVRSLPGLRRT